MALGDSITWGIGSSTGNGYRGYLGDKLSSEGHALDFVGTQRNGTMSDPDNEGHSGWRIDQIAGIADATLKQYRPNVVTLEIGTNDLNQNYQVPTATDRLHALIDRITAAAPDATVLVGTLIVSTNPVEEPGRPAFNKALPGIVQAEQAAGRHVRLVDMGTLTTADLSDQLHPGDSGYQKMSDAFNTGVQAADAAGWIKAPVAVRSGPVHSGIAGKCLDVKGANPADGTAVQIWSCNGSGAHVWTLSPDGTLRALGRCLDVAGAGTANGSRIQLWSCNGHGNQQWRSADGTLVNPVSGKCLDDPRSSSTNGTQLQIWACNGAANQKWTAP
ncbi:ricin-type beta-trefoil lectin domain protein [Kitasatospora sp. NPDC057223]|uniref:ricin-type beta-trefoil lectin domain protein n=1 Tax=Kitasatospora sp. NPDC057223 TaxID=3346055 RepID=UPI00362D2763